MINVISNIFMILHIYTCIEYNTFFLLKLITCDSMIAVYEYLIRYYEYFIYDKKINYVVYEMSIIDRYVCYSFISIIYNYLLLLLWSNYNYYLDMMICFVSLPLVINTVLKKNFFTKYKKFKSNIILSLLSSEITILIKFTMKKLLNINEKIYDFTDKDIKKFLEEKENIKNDSLKLIKNLLILIVLYLLKKYSNRLYYSSIKYLYGYKYNDIIFSFSKKSSKNYILQIIKNREWNELTNINFIKSVITIIENKNNYNVFNFNYLYQFLNNIMICWTLSSFFNCHLIIPLISYSLLLFNKNYENILCGSFYYFTIFTLTLIFSSGQYLLTCLIIENLRIIITNKYTHHIFTYIQNRIYKYYISLIKFYIDSIKLNLILLFYSYVNVLFLNNVIINYVFLNLLFDKDILSNLSIFLLLGNISNYNIRHMMSIFLFLLINDKHKIDYYYYICYIFNVNNSDLIINDYFNKNKNNLSIYSNTKSFIAKIKKKKIIKINNYF